MRYKYRRRYRKILRWKQVGFRDIKKILLLVVTLGILWLAFFQGAPWADDHIRLGPEKEEVKQTLEVVDYGLWPLLWMFVVAIAIKILFDLLNAYFFWESWKK